MVLGIYGTGGLGRETHVLAKQINAIGKRWGRLIFIDDARSGNVCENTETYSFAEMCDKYSNKEIEISIAVGEPFLRGMMAQKVSKEGYSLAILVHPSACVSESAKIGLGTIICAGSFVSCGVKIGENVLIQPHGSIGHDCLVGDNAVISSFVSLAGECNIGERVYIGMSVPVKEAITIGKDSIIGMGSVVLRDIPEGVIALGNPARPMKENVDKRVFGK